MTDDEGSMDSMDTEEDIFSGRNRRSGSSSVRRMKNLRTLRSHSGSAQHIDRNNQSSVRRSTRNRMQTYDNLNTSWLLGIEIKFQQNKPFPLKSTYFSVLILKHIMLLYNVRNT